MGKARGKAIGHIDLRGGQVGEDLGGGDGVGIGKQQHNRYHAGIIGRCQARDAGVGIAAHRVQPAPAPQ